MPIEVRKRRDSGEIGIVIVRDKGEPESQLGKPYGGRREIDAKQRVGKDVALDGRDGPIAGGAPERRQFVERAQQEGSRSDRRIEDGESAQVRSGSRWDAIVHPASSGRRTQTKSIGQRGFEARTHHSPDQRRRGVVAAARPAFVGIHDTFEHATQHVGRDEFAGIVLADGEVEALEQIVERGAPVAVAPNRGAVLSLEGRGFEQPAIEEWDLAERTSGSSALSGRAIEGAEAQRVKKGAMKVVSP